MREKKIVDPSLFENREEAFKELLPTIYINPSDLSNTILIAVSKAGIYLAYMLSKALKVKMNILLSEEILAPNNSELPIAMVSETEEMVMHQPYIKSFGIDKDYVYSQAQHTYEEVVLKHIYQYRKGIPLEPLNGKHIILVDECIETGLTMMVALKSMIEMDVRSLYVAVPILDKSIYPNLLTLCDGVFCPHQIDNYISIEYYYRNAEDLDFQMIEEMIEDSGILDEHKQIKE
jgi:putative phosphoribosyl transferase